MSSTPIPAMPAGWPTPETTKPGADGRAFRSFQAPSGCAASRMLAIGFDAELLQEVTQRIGLCGEILGGGRGLFDHRGVLLRHLIHASNGTVDLMQPTHPCGQQY